MKITVALPNQSAELPWQLWLRRPSVYDITLQLGIPATGQVESLIGRWWWERIYRRKCECGDMGRAVEDALRVSHLKSLARNKTLACGYFNYP